MKQQKKLIDWQQSRPVYREKRKNSGRTEVVRCTGNSIIAVLFLLSSVWMIRDVFPEMKVTVFGMMLSGVMIACFTFWNGLQADVKCQKRRIAGNLLLAVIFAVGCYLYYRMYGKSIEDGGLALGQLYLERWNEYYDTTVNLAGGNAESISLALSYGMLAAVTVLQMSAGVFRKWWLMSVLPLAVCVLELLVGYTPGWRSFVLLYAGIVLGSCVFWKRIYPGKRRMIWIGVSVVLVVLVVTCGLTGPAHYLASKEEQMKVVQDNLEGSLKNLSVQMFHGNIEEGSVDNHTPKYNNEEVMKIHMDGSSNGERMYLRGYYGSDYVNSEWKNEDDTFAKACEEQGITPEQGAELLANEQYMSAMAEAPGEVVDYSVEYTGIQDTYTYSLYPSNYSSMENVQITGDYLILKKENQKSFTATANLQNWNMFHWEDAGGNLDMYADIYGGVWADESAFFSWYNSYVMANYLDVPQQEVTARKIADEIGQSALADIDYGGTDAVNMKRIIYTQLVRDELASRGMYSLYLDSPGNQDPIEYFLSVSHKGYCVHFASAGVFILRELGVPARYATGYITKESGTTETDGTTDYIVEDNCAHAWVEIYLNNYGWVPMEMTPGYDDEQTKLPSEWTRSETQKNNEGKEKIIQRQEEQADESIQNDAQTNQNPDQVNAVGEEGFIGSGEEVSENGLIQEKDTDTETNTDTNTENQTKSAETIALMLAIAGIWILFLYLIAVRPKQKEQFWNKKLEKELERKQYNKAVRQLNRKIYSIVMQKQHFKKSAWSDREYFEMLTGFFPEIRREDWKRYMEIVQKAVFSDESISREEAEFCQKIFRTLPKRQDKNFKK